MQLSKLTFSLASLVLISALVFATTPVMAADDGPEVTLGAALTGSTDRMALEIEVTFSPAVVVDEVAAADLKYTLLDGAGAPLNITHTNADADSVARTDTTATGTTDTKFTFTLPDFSSASTFGTARSVILKVPADGANALNDLKVSDPLLGNQASASVTYTLPPVHAAKVSFGAATPVANMPGQFAVTVTFDSGQTTNALDLSRAIQFSVFWQYFSHVLIF